MENNTQDLLLRIEGLDKLREIVREPYEQSGVKLANIADALNQGVIDLIKALTSNLQTDSHQKV